MTRRLASLVLLCAALAATAGCSKTYKIQIQSNTCWDGLVNNDLGIADCGDANYKVVGRLQCVRLQKTTVAGYLRVRIEGRPWAETTDDRGTVQVCN